MKIKILRKLEIDLDNRPADFDDLILEAFKRFTHGTREEYMYQDKLLFIDNCVKYLHKDMDSSTAVKKKIIESAAQVSA